MNRKIIAFYVVIFILFFPFIAQPEPIPENIIKSVAYIVTSEADENRPIGTGFFVGYKYPENSGHNYIFLVTAKHVLFDDKGNRHPRLLLRINERLTGRSKDLNILKSKAWFFHKNEAAVDIAVQPLLPRSADFVPIPSELFVTRELLVKNNIGIGDDVFYAGLLSYHSGREKIAPIVRFGRLSLVTNEETIDGKFYHFIDAGNIPGHSGSPVFLWATPVREAGVLVVNARIFGLYGIVAGVLEYNKKLKVTVPRNTIQQVIPLDARSGGITAIVPVKYLSEILQSQQVKTAIGLKAPK